MGSGSFILLLYVACGCSVAFLFIIGGGLVAWDRVERRRKERRSSRVSATRGTDARTDHMELTHEAKWGRRAGIALAWILFTYILVVAFTSIPRQVFFPPTSSESRATKTP